MEAGDHRWTFKISARSLTAIRGEVRKAVVGQDDVIDLMLTSLLVGGHILLEGVPGTAKTLLARAFAASLVAASSAASSSRPT